MIFNMTAPVLKKKDHVPVLGEDFTYSGSCQVIDDSANGDVQWRIKFLTSGTLTVLTADWLVDLFLVGGGARGTSKGSYSGAPGSFRAGCNGGRGGSVRTVKSLTAAKGTSYSIVVGGSGGTTSALGQSAASGGGGTGGSGGAYTTAGDSYNNGGSGGIGSREFGEAGGAYYAGGGGGGGSGVFPDSDVRAPEWKWGTGGSGGTRGGGAGGKGASWNTSTKYVAGTSGGSGTANTGGGGGGGGGGTYVNSTTQYDGGSGGNGGSGIVIIRKHKEVA